MTISQPAHSFYGEEVAIIRQRRVPLPDPLVRRADGSYFTIAPQATTYVDAAPPPRRRVSSIAPNCARWPTSWPTTAPAERPPIPQAVGSCREIERRPGPGPGASSADPAGATRCPGAGPTMRPATARRHAPRLRDTRAAGGMTGDAHSCP